MKLSNYSEGTKPFNMGINVYSLEEAVYYCRINQESRRYMLTKEFADWVKNECGLEEESEKIRNLIKSFEGAKSEGDMFFSKGKYMQALKSYEAAEKNDKIMNNAAVCHMKLKNFNKAAEILKNTDYMNNSVYFYNLVEACIFSEHVDEALRLIRETPFEDYRNIYYKALALYRAGKYRQALESIENTDYDADGAFLLADIYAALNRLTDAVEIMKAQAKSERTAIRLSELYSALRDDSAVKIIEKELIKDKDNINLWLAYAKAFRLLKDLASAERAALKAKTLDSGSIRVYFEYALIYKARGDSKGYEKMLDIIISSCKSLCSREIR